MQLGKWSEACGRFIGTREEHGKKVVTLEFVGDIEVEKDVDIDVDQGEFIGILRTDNGHLLRKG